MKSCLDCGLTRDDSLSIKGIAILMLVLFHLFGEYHRFEGYAVDFWPLSTKTVVNISHLCRLCVSIFAFITGYGLLKSIQHIVLNKNTVSKWIVTRLIKTMSGFWFVYLIAFTVTMLIDRLPLHTYFADGTTTTAGIFYMLNDALGLANLMGTPTLCGTWWYMSCAIILILVVPVVYACSRKFGYMPVVMLLVALPRLFDIGYPGGTNAYTFILPMVFGMIFADDAVFEWIDSKLPRNRVLAYISTFAVFGLLCCFAYYIHCSHYDRLVAWELYFGVIPLFFICFFRYCVIRIPVVSPVLRFLGKHSMTIFLTHTFIRYTYLNDLVYGTFRHFVLIYMLLLVLSIALALVLDYAKRLCRYDRLVNAVLARIPAVFDKPSVTPPQWRIRRWMPKYLTYNVPLVA